MFLLDLSELKASHNISLYAIVAMGIDLNRISLISFRTLLNNRKTNTTTA
jgi:hypothetical protein